jgi:hypothetical protein
MDIGSILLILALLIPVVIFISRPLLEASPVNVNHSEQDISTLLANRDQVVAAIQELDADYALGKIPPEIYPEQRNNLLQAGAEILRQLDGYQSTPTLLPAEDRLEEAIVARRLSMETEPISAKKNGNAVPPVPDDDIEQRIASRRRTMNDKAAGFCPKCGRPVQVSDRFCPKCGATLA